MPSATLRVQIQQWRPRPKQLATRQIAAIKSIAVTLNLDFIERLHQMGTPVTWIQSLFTVTWETVGWSGGSEKILLRSHNDERGNDKNVENK